MRFGIPRNRPLSASQNSVDDSKNTTHLICQQLLSNSWSVCYESGLAWFLHPCVPMHHTGGCPGDYTCTFGSWSVDAAQPATGQKEGWQPCEKIKVRVCVCVCVWERERERERERENYPQWSTNNDWSRIYLWFMYFKLVFMPGMKLESKLPHPQYSYWSFPPFAIFTHTGPVPGDKWFSKSTSSPSFLSITIIKCGETINLPYWLNMMFFSLFKSFTNYCYTS